MNAASVPDSGGSTEGAGPYTLVCQPTITGYPGPGTIWRPDLWLSWLKGEDDEEAS